MATPFEHEFYDTELTHCQRYYYQTQSLGDNAQHWNIPGRIINGQTQSMFTIAMPAPMRAAPTLALTPAYDTEDDWNSNLAGVSNYAWTGTPTFQTDGVMSLMASFYVSHSSTGTNDYIGKVVQPYTPTGASANFITFSADY